MCTQHSPTSSPSSCLDSTRLKVTHVEAFWRAVEQTVAAGHLVPGNDNLPDVHGLSASALSNSVIILPRIVTRLHPVHQSPEEHIYRFAQRSQLFYVFGGNMIVFSLDLLVFALYLQGLGSLGCGFCHSNAPRVPAGVICQNLSQSC